jgi:hypothetical protein
VLALLAAVIAISLYWWFSQTQRAEEVALNATVTAVNQATATAEAANAANAAAQATATAAQAATQEAANAQATAAAQQAAAASATAAAQQAAQAAGADVARATAQAVSVDATVGARSTQAAAVPPAPTQTPVVLVVTATPAPPTAVPTAPPTVVPPAPPAPAANPQPTPAPPSNTGEVPTGVLPPPVASPAVGNLAQPGGSPAPAPGASPVAAPPAARGGASSVTVTAGQPTILRCLDDHVQAQAAPGALPPQTSLTCRPIDPGSVPPPPEPIVGGTVFDLTSSSGTSTTLPGKLDLTVTYAAGVVPVEQRESLTLGYLNGDHWEALPGQAPDPDQTVIGAKVDRPGVYGLYQQP